MDSNFMMLCLTPTTRIIVTRLPCARLSGTATSVVIQMTGRQPGGRFAHPLRGRAQLRGLDARRVRGGEAEAPAPAGPSRSPAPRPRPGSHGGGAASAHEDLARTALLAAQEKSGRFGRAAARAGHLRRR